MIRRECDQHDQDLCDDSRPQSIVWFDRWGGALRPRQVVCCYYDIGLGGEPVRLTGPR